MKISGHVAALPCLRSLKLIREYGAVDQHDEVNAQTVEFLKAATAELTLEPLPVLPPLEDSKNV